MLTDPRMLVLALAAESSSVAWGFGALGWICFMGFFVGICVCLCIHMMRNADPKVCLFAFYVWKKKLKNILKKTKNI